MSEWTHACVCLYMCEWMIKGARESMLDYLERNIHIFNSATTGHVGPHRPAHSLHVTVIYKTPNTNAIYLFVTTYRYTWHFVQQY